MDKTAMKVMVVDDEEPARERMKQIVASLDEWQVCGEASHGEAALRKLKELQPDVILLDIRMPGMDGLETAKHLAATEQPPAVIFTTAYEEHALEAFEANAVGYLVKPVRKSRLQEALNHAKRVTRAQLASISVEQDVPECRTHVCARTRGDLQLIPIEDIIFFQADQKYVTVCHTEGEVLIEESLKQLESEFSHKFVRIHRNALASLSYLEGLHKCADGSMELQLRGSETALSISRRHLPQLRKRLRESKLA